jgi:hypothetical protein
VWGDGGKALGAMRVVTARVLRRWAVVAAGTGVLCALPAIVAAWPVPASALSAAQLRTRMMASSTVAYQGYAESDVSLDLPTLPDLSDVISLLDGTTDQYAWYRSPGQWRADVLTTAGEEDTYQTGGGTYVWDYSRNLLTEVTGVQAVRLPRASDLLPPMLARRLLAYAGVAGNREYRLPSQRIAGIDAAGLRLVPTSSQTTIGAVEVWADPATGLPVQVEVFARGASTPVLVTRFLEVSLSRPSLATVTPHPGPGIGFTLSQLPDVSGLLNGFAPPLPDTLAGLGQVANPSGLADVAAYGAGLTRFAVIPLPSGVGNTAMTKASLVGAAIKLQFGSGVLVTTPLLTMVLAAPPGGPVYLLTGAVTPRLLEQAASQLLTAQ